MAKTRFCAHAFGLDFYSVFGTSGLVRELQEGPGGSRDGSRKAPRRPCKSGPLLVLILAKSALKIDPKGVQELIKNRFKNGA